MDTLPIKTLAAAVADILASGLPQDAAVAHYIASTHGDADAAGLAALLAHGDDPAVASLRELLLFPGPAVAARLEPALAAARLDAAAAQELAEILAATVDTATVILPDGQRLAVPLDRDDIRSFVVRLRPEHSAPQDVALALAERFPPQAALDLAVRCRQAGLDWTPPRRSFFLALLGRLASPFPESPQSPEPYAVVEFALRFLSDLPPAAPPLAALPRLRERLAAQLHRARNQEEALAKSNFETLIMTGARLPYLHAASLARELRLADAAILAVTGRPAADPGPASLDLGTVSDAEGLLRASGRPEE